MSTKQVTPTLTREDGNRAATLLYIFQDPIGLKVLIETAHTIGGEFEQGIASTFGTTEEIEKALGPQRGMRPVYRERE